jgi:hypothetical protein
MTTPQDDSHRPENPYPDPDQTNVGRHPIDRLMEAQKREIFPEWERNWKKVSAGSDDENGPSTEKRPVHLDTAEPLFLMTQSEPKKGQPRSWGSLRRDTLAAPNGYEGEHHNSGPLINWAYSRHTPETWEKLKHHYLSENEEADRMVVNLSLKGSKGFKAFYNQVLQDDDETVAINPPDVIRTFSNKLRAAEHMDRHDLPTIPSTEASTLFYEGEEEVVNQVGNDDQPYILKPTNGTGGSGIQKAEDLGEVRRLLSTKSGIMELLEDSYDDQAELRQAAEEYADNPDDLWSGYIIQPELEHEADNRIIRFGDTTVNAEKRFAPEDEDDPRTNLSQIPSEFRGEELTIYGEIMNALEEGRIEPIYLDHLGHPQREDELGQGARKLADDIMASFDSDEYNFDGSLDQPPIKVGIDAMEVHRDDVGHLPDEWIERAMRYADGDTLYFVPELNGNPGGGADVLAMYNDAPEQLTPIHMYNFMREQAGLEPYSLNEVVHNYDETTPEGQVFLRALGYYPSFDQPESDFIEHAKKNVRPQDR